jgi:hypothetical protein
MKVYFYRTTIYLTILFGCLFIFSIGCSSTQTPRISQRLNLFTVSELEGTWLGEWQWCPTLSEKEVKKEEINLIKGEIKLTIQRLEPSVWKWEIFAEGLRFFNKEDKLIVTFKEENSQRLYGESLGCKGTVQLAEDEKGKKLDVDIVIPFIMVGDNEGKINANLSYDENTMIGNYSMLFMNGKGTITLERKKYKPADKSF